MSRYKTGDILVCVKHYDSEDRSSLIIGKEYVVVNDNYEAYDNYPLLIVSETGPCYYRHGNFKKKDEIRCECIDSILK